jgi:hypothetical protein
VIVRRIDIVEYVKKKKKKKKIRRRRSIEKEAREKSSRVGESTHLLFVVHAIMECLRVWERWSRIFSWSRTEKEKREGIELAVRSVCPCQCASAHALTADD